VFLISALICRAATYVNVTDVREEGFGVYFSYDDLEKQGKLSSDVNQPWKRVLESVLEIARKHKQVYVVAWYPSRFGNDLHVDRNDKYKHFSLIQEIVPTRTGLNGIKSKAAVWLTSVNETEP
jgi:hypothetical protein